MQLVMQVLAQLLMRSAVLVCRHGSTLIKVLVLLVLCLMIQVPVCCLMGDFLHQICGCRVIRPRDMVFLF
jgi:hypothetical protein